MSISAALQKLIYDALVADTGVHSYVADKIYDGVPDDAEFPYVSFGPTDWEKDDADCVEGRRETIQIDVWSRDQARLRICKEIVDAVSDALDDFDGDMADPYALAGMDVMRGQVMPDPDGITAHGVLVVQCMTERTGSSVVPSGPAFDSGFSLGFS